MLWSIDCRPDTISDVILPERLKTTLQAIVDNNEMPNMVFAGGPGCGKTTSAIALCKDLGYEYMMINASDDRNIDTLRDKVTKFASTVSIEGSSMKVVIFDEADYLNAQSTQPALRNFMETYAGNCRFIMTCNNASRIHDAILSRNPVVDFNITASEMNALVVQMYKRIQDLLNENDISFDPKVVLTYIKETAPDWRKIINTIQIYGKSGHINTAVIDDVDDAAHAELIGILKTKNFRDMRMWVAEHSDIDPVKIFKSLYTGMSDVIQEASQPSLVLILADYQDKSQRAVDQEINTAAALTEIMKDVKFK